VEGNGPCWAPDCEVFPHANIGGEDAGSQVQGRPPGLRIGAQNVFREYVTVHARRTDGDVTVIGSHNTVLAYCHVAHDCVLGDHIVMSNSILLAGHVTVEDHVTIGGAAGVHQFCRIGAYAMLSVPLRRSCRMCRRFYRRRHAGRDPR
jgi:UDP-N-acetylglucosamine acyltransferase